MTVVLWDIDATKRRQNNTLNDSTPLAWSLDEYYKVARRCIGAFASGSLAQSMLRNEDAISFVAEHLMYSAFRWEKEREGGRTLHCYLNQCAIWSIYRWIVLLKRAETKGVPYSLNLDDCPDSHSQFYERIADEKADSPSDDIEAREQTNTIANIIDGAGLTDHQRQCIEFVYIHGKRKVDVARHLGVSRQAVDQCLNNGIRKLRVALDDNEHFFA